MSDNASAIRTSILTAFELEFGQQSDPSPYLNRFITALKDCDIGETIPNGHDTASLPTYVRHMSAMRSTMADTAVSRALSQMIDKIDWYQIFDGDGIDSDFASGLLAGQIIGKRGLIRNDDVFVGLFLIAPDICYPLHQHPALEVYYVLSGHINIRHGRTKTPMRIGPGALSVTPPHQVHELETGDEACLIAYIWTGDMKGENWWWEEQTDGSWDRICWERQADSSWAIAKREPLTETEVTRAGDG